MNFRATIDDVNFFADEKNIFLKTNKGYHKNCLEMRNNNDEHALTIIC